MSHTDEEANVCTVRIARESDVEAIFAVRLAVRENAMTMTELAEAGVTPQTFAEAIREQQATWVAESGNRVIGFASIDPEESSLFALFVEPAAEGQGAGGMLLEAAEAALFERSEEAWLETAETSMAARFYARRGWIVSARHPAADLDPGDVRMVKQRR